MGLALEQPRDEGSSSPNDRCDDTIPDQSHTGIEEDIALIEF